MAIKTLEGIKAIGKFRVIDMEKLKEEYPSKFNESGAMDYKWFESEIRPNYFVYVRQDVSSLSFTLQNGPVKTEGLNGCQVDTIIEAARIMLDGLNKSFPCRENALALTKLDEALHWLEARKKDRENRGVEGENKA